MLARAGPLTRAHEIDHFLHVRLEWNIETLRGDPLSTSPLSIVACCRLHIRVTHLTRDHGQVDPLVQVLKSANSTIACSPRLRKRATTLRMIEVRRLAREPMAGIILHKISAEDESESRNRSGVSSTDGPGGRGEKRNELSSDEY